MPKNGKDYEDVFRPRVPRPPRPGEITRPDVLPTPPKDYSLSKPAKAFLEAFTPHANLDELRSRLTVMGGPAAGYGNFAREAVRGAAGMLGDFKTLGSEPALSQPWWNAAVRTGTEALGAARVLGGHGGYRGTKPYIKSNPRMYSESEIPPPLPGAKPYKPLPPIKGEDYLASFRQALEKNDTVGANNILRNSSREGTMIPLRPADMMKMPPMVAREFMTNYVPSLERLYNPLIK